jgi:hypothetical protein
MWRLSCLVDRYTQTQQMRIGQGDYRPLRQNRPERGSHPQQGDLAIHHPEAGLDMGYVPATYNQPPSHQNTSFQQNKTTHITQNRKKLHSMALNPITFSLRNGKISILSLTKTDTKNINITYSTTTTFLYTYTIIHSI